MYIGRGASYISGVYVVGLLNVSHGVPLQICVSGGCLLRRCNYEGRYDG